MHSVMLLWNLESCEILFVLVPQKAQTEVREKELKVTLSWKILVNIILNAYHKI